MERFVYGSEQFRDRLGDDAHLAGELEFLGSVVRPGMHVMDIGANRGVTTVAIAKAVGASGRVYAFEPVPEYYAELQSNLSRNGVDNVRTYMLALSDRTGRIPFYRHGEGSGVTPAGGATKISVKAASLPDVLAKCEIARIDLINLDCEGSELLVLRAGQAVLQRHGPGIFCEIHHGYLRELGQSADAVVELLRSIGYEVRPIQVTDLSAATSFGECSHIYAFQRGPLGNSQTRTTAAAGRPASDGGGRGPRAVP